MTGPTIEEIKAFREETGCGLIDTVRILTSRIHHKALREAKAEMQRANGSDRRVLELLLPIIEHLLGPEK